MMGCYWTPGYQFCYKFCRHTGHIGLLPFLHCTSGACLEGGVWGQHHEVHLQHPLSGVPSLTKQRQQAILGKSGSDPGPSKAAQDPRSLMGWGG